MENITNSRSVGKPHWVAVVTALFVASVLLAANLDGYVNELFTDHEFPGGPFQYNWTHGWPSTFMVRASIYPLSGIYTATGGFTGDYGEHSRWPIDGAQVYALWIKPLLFDCVFFNALILGSAYAAQRFGHWWNPRNSYGLKTLFIGTAVVAAGLVFVPVMLADEHRYALYYTTLSVAGVAAMLTFFSLAHLAYRVRRRLR